MLSLGKIKKLVKQKLKDNHPDRYTHTLGVVKMSKKLAKKYGVDKKKAMIAAYMHDFCKYDEEVYIKSLLDEEDKKECEEYPVLYHSYGSAAYYKTFVGNDKDIYNAIKNHVFGRLNMSRLEEIILISDYTEENRIYNNCVECRAILLKGEFYKAIYESMKFTIAYLEKKNKKAHPLQVEVLKYYEGLCDL